MIGQVGSNSGILGAIVLQMVRGVQAWVAGANAKGGVACHPIKYISYDDGGDPSRRASLVRQLVERDGAIAMVEMTDAVSGSEQAAKYFEEKRIPVIGDSGGVAWAYRNTMYFPQGGSAYNLPEQVFGAAAAVALPAGKSKVGAIYCIEAPLCASAFNYAEPQARKFGMALAYRAKVSLAQPDYTSTCQAAQAAGVEVLVVNLDSNSQKRMARSCLSVNFKPIFAGLAITYNSSLAADPNLDGLTIATPTFPWFDPSNPAVAEFQQTMKRYVPGVELSASALQGWAGAKMFEYAAQKVSEPPTPASLLEAVWSMKDNDLDGLAMPLTFTKDQPAPNRYCFWTVQIKAGQPTMPVGTERRCQDGT